jgi:hypothetical protein
MACEKEYDVNRRIEKMATFFSDVFMVDYIKSDN